MFSITKNTTIEKRQSNIIMLILNELKSLISVGDFVGFFVACIVSGFNIGYKDIFHSFSAQLKSAQTNTSVIVSYDSGRCFSFVSFNGSVQFDMVFCVRNQNYLDLLQNDGLYLIGPALYGLPFPTQNQRYSHFLQFCWE